MKELQRYRLDSVEDECWMDEHSNGDYVLFTDHQAALESLLAQQTRLTALVEKWRSIDKGYPSEYIAANHDCADELSAVLEEGK